MSLGEPFELRQWESHNCHRAVGAQILYIFGRLSLPFHPKKFDAAVRRTSAGLRPHDATTVYLHGQGLGSVTVGRLSPYIALESQGFERAQAALMKWFGKQASDWLTTERFVLFAREAKIMHAATPHTHHIARDPSLGDITRLLAEGRVVLAQTQPYFTLKTGPQCHDVLVYRHNTGRYSVYDPAKQPMLAVYSPKQLRRVYPRILGLAAYKPM